MVHRASGSISSACKVSHTVSTCPILKQRSCCLWKFPGETSAGDAEAQADDMLRCISAYPRCTIRGATADIANHPPAYPIFQYNKSPSSSASPDGLIDLTPRLVPSRIAVTLGREDPVKMENSSFKLSGITSSPNITTDTRLCVQTLQTHHLCIFSAELYQLIMCSSLNHPALLKKEYSIGLLDGAQAVSHSNSGPTF